MGPAVLAGGLALVAAEHPAEIVDIRKTGFDGIEYTRAVRSFYRELREEFPDLILENCGSGGLRSDYGMLRIFDVQSTSDQEIAANYPSIVQGALAMQMDFAAVLYGWGFQAEADTQPYHPVCTLRTPGELPPLLLAAR